MHQSLLEGPSDLTGFRARIGAGIAKPLYLGVPLMLVALLGPYVIGFQYLEWLHSSSSHLTWLIDFPLASVEYSDWIEEGWIIRTVQFQHVPPIPVAMWALLIVIRVSFATAVLLFHLGRLQKDYVVLSGVFVAGISVVQCIQLMMANVILGIPPGILINIVAPDVDMRLFVPAPLLLVFGFLVARVRNLALFTQEGLRP
jgi:hypothetical protein